MLGYTSVGFRRCSHHISDSVWQAEVSWDDGFVGPVTWEKTGMSPGIKAEMDNVVPV